MKSRKNRSGGVALSCGSWRPYAPTTPSVARASVRRTSHCGSAGTASCVVKTSTSPRERPAARLRVAPCTNSAGGIWCTVAPSSRARSTLPSVDPESTTTTSTSSSTSWAPIASRHRTRSAPPFFTGMRTEITVVSRRRRTGTREAKGAVARDRRRDVERHDPVPSSLERLLERLLSKEVRVRPVEDPPVGVTPPACEESQAHRPVRHVRRREHELAARPQKWPHPGQERLRIPQMLDHGSAEHDVEGMLRKREIHRLDVTDQHLFADCARLFRCLLVVVDAHDRRATLGEPPCEVAGRAAHVEHLFRRPGEGEQAFVPSVRPRIERDVRRAAHAAGRPLVDSNDGELVQRIVKRLRKNEPSTTCTPSPKRVKPSAVA